MRIRFQILLTVLPIFLALGLVAGSLKYTSRLADVLSGTEEELFTLAVALSEFLGSADCRAFLEDGAPEDDHLAIALRRVMDANPIAHLRLLGAHEGSGRYSLGEAPATPDGERRIDRKPRDGVLLSPVIERREGPWTAEAIATVADESGPFAVLAVEIDAGDVRTLRREILVESLLLAGGIPVCGIVVSWFLGGLVTSAIRHLSRATRVVASGRYDWRVKRGWLREVNDLNNTFNTMTTLLAEILSRTKRAVIEGEQFRKPVHLAETFARQLWREGDTRLGSVTVSMTRLGRRPTGDFLAARCESGRARVVMGSVTSAGGLESVALASAAYALVREELDADLERHGFSLAETIIPFRYWSSLTWRDDSSAVEVWSCRFGERPKREAVRLKPGHPLALHGLDEDSSDRFELYLKILRGLDSRHLPRELALALGDPAEGGVLIVSSV